MDFLTFGQDGKFKLTIGNGREDSTMQFQVTK